MQAHHEHLKDFNLKVKRRLVYVIFLNFAISAAEAIGGFLAGSLSLLSDSLHNFSDAMSIVITYLAHRISLKGASYRKTFGYRRSTILAALFNSTTLLVIGFFLIKEAIERLLEPKPIDSVTVLWVAIIGLFANLLSMYLLRRWSGKDINIRSAYLHMLSDALSSIAVILGAIAMLYFGLFWIDPVLTIAIALYVVRESFKIMNRSIDILMQSAPQEIDVREVVKRLEGLSEIKDVHHVHLWNLDDKTVFFEGHVNLKEDLPVSRAMDVYKKIEGELLKMGISHITVQFEYCGCPECGVIKSLEERGYRDE